MFLKRRRKKSLKRKKVRRSRKAGIVFLFLFVNFILGLYSYDFEIFITGSNKFFYSKSESKFVRPNYYGQDAELKEEFSLRTETGVFAGGLFWFSDDAGILITIENLTSGSITDSISYSIASPDGEGLVREGKEEISNNIKWNDYSINLSYKILKRDGFNAYGFIGVSIFDVEFEYPLEYSFKEENVNERYDVVLTGITKGVKKDKLYGFNVGVLIGKRILDNVSFIGGVQFKSTRIDFEREVEFFIDPEDFESGAYKDYINFSLEIRPFEVFLGISYHF